MSVKINLMRLDVMSSSRVGPYKVGEIRRSGDHLVLEINDRHEGYIIGEDLEAGKSVNLVVQANLSFSLHGEKKEQW